MIRINFNIDPELHLAIKRFAGLHGESVTHYLRRILQSIHSDDCFTLAISKIYMQDKAEEDEK